MKNLLLFPALLLCSFLSFSQIEFDYDTELNRRISVPTSPEASAFGSYGDIPVDLRVGKPQVSIPLYTYKGNEFDIPISLTYDIDARKVEDIASNVGLGWNLNLGARITRRVNEKADDPTITSGAHYNTIYNTSTLRQDYIDFRDTFYDHNMDNQLQNIEFASQTTAEKYFDFLLDIQLGLSDVVLDTYTLSGLGLSDDIIMLIDEDNNTLVPTPVNNPRLKIEDHGAYWTVVDDAGVQYIFAEEEITETSHDDDTGSNNKPPIAIDMKYTSSWLLTKIISPNGKDVYEFTYTDFGFWQNDVSLWVTQITNTPKPHPQVGTIEREINPSHEYKIMQQFLTEVKHNGNVIIDIDLKARDDLNTDSAIESITIKDPVNSSNIINYIEFDHDYFGTHIVTGDEEKELRLRLDEVKIAGNGYDAQNPSFEKKYSFVYESPGDMPRRDSVDQDWLGFYNDAGNTAGTMYPAWDIDGYNFSGADRDFDLASAKVGILNRINYPQEGYTEFVYGQHGESGVNYAGIRVDSIINYTDTGVIATKKAFSYSGLVENFEKNLTYETDDYYINTSGDVTLRTKYNRVAKATLGDQPYISYDQVTVTNVNPNTDNADYGSTVNIFYNDNDDDDDYDGIRIDESYPFVSHYYDNIEKGNLKRSTVTADGGTDVTKVSKDYTPDTTISYYTDYTFTDYPKYKYYFVELYWKDAQQNAVMFQYVEGRYNSGIWGPPPPDTNNITFLVGEAYASIQPARIYMRLRNEDLQSSTETKYLDGNQVTTTTTTDFDSTINYLPRKTTVTTSDSNKTLITEYKYPEDYSGDTVIDKLIAANKIASPMQVENFQKIGAASAELLSTQKTEYNDWGGIDVYGSVTQMDLIAPRYIKTAKGTITVGNPLETRVSFSDYDDDGNLVSVSQAYGATTSYVWGYNGQYLVAKIENKSYAQLPSSIVANIESTTGETALNGYLDQLRNDASMSDAQVTTYTYRPQIGVRTITDPKGYRMTYVYDDENRLKYVLDKDEKVVGENQYNYRINN